MMILDLYILRRFSSTLLFSVLALLFTIVIVDLIGQVDTFIDHQARLTQIIRYYLFHMPYWFVLTMPIAVLLAALFSLTGLARRNEIMAMKTVGISLYRLLLPVYLFALALSGLVLLIADRLVPNATFHYNTVRNEIRSYSRPDGSRRQILLQNHKDQLVFARSYDAKRQRATSVHWERLEDSRVTRRLTANYLTWYHDHWVLVDGHSYHFNDTTIQATAFDSMALPQLTLKPEDFSRQLKKPEEMDYKELSNYIKRTQANGEDTTRNMVDLYLKISFPFTCFIIVLLGAPIAINARHTGLAISFGQGTFICFIFYSFVQAGQALGWNKLLSPFWAAWLPNILFGVLGIIFLWRAHK